MPIQKRIVICFDGTWNKPDKNKSKESTETNVYRLYEAVKEIKTGKVVRQLKWYDKGVGTKWYEKIRGSLGYGLSKNIQEGYGQLIDWYEDGDEIFVFGFSRGAYSARSLIGLINNCGLLKRENKKLISKAYEMYRHREKEPKSEEATNFRELYSKEIKVKFLGVWDTVGALGIPLEAFKALNDKKYNFHDTKFSSVIENVFHALAVDEHREDYNVTLFEQDTKVNIESFEQCWFPGAHSDVGGSYNIRALSDISLEWMMGKAKKFQLEFKTKTLPIIKDENYLSPIHDSYTEFLKGIYSSLKGRYYRKIFSDQLNNETINDSVKIKVQKDKTYRPKNLEDIVYEIKLK